MLGRAGFDSYQIALLARRGSAAVFGYIRDSPLAHTSTIARRAVEMWEGADPDRPSGSGAAPSRAERPEPVVTSGIGAGTNPEKIRELEARIASLGGCVGPRPFGGRDSAGRTALGGRGLPDRRGQVRARPWAFGAQHQRVSRRSGGLVRGNTPRNINEAAPTGGPLPYLLRVALRKLPHLVI